MGDSSATPVSPAAPNRDRLDSWKEIAAYLSRDVTTVQRWEKREGMPVHRHQHDKIGSVYAFREELDAWARSRKIGSVAAEMALPDSTSPALEPRAASRSLQRKFSILLLPLVVAGIGVLLWLRSKETFWKSPIEGARFQMLTDFDGVEQAAAISHDGHLVAFLSNRDGPTDVWITQVGSGQFHNLTHGTAPELVNPSVRTLGFTPDDSLVTFWVRKSSSTSGGDISIWAVPTLGGDAKPYLDGVAEYDWSHDGHRLAYHTPGPGDPLFVSDGGLRPQDQSIFKAPAGLHSHFPLWSPDGAFIYLVQGALPDKLDIWRLLSRGGIPERITSQNARVSHPVFLDQRTLLYLASDPDGSGPWLYGIDVERRIPHRLTSGLDQYTSLAASADGRRLVATLASPKNTLWRLTLPNGIAEATAPVRVSMVVGTGISPRLASDYLVYIAATGTGESIRKIANGTATELFHARDARFVGAPAISSDSRLIAFSVQQQGKTLLYMMQADGSNVHVLADSLKLQGSPAWSPGGQFILTAAEIHGEPRLYRVPVDGKPPVPFVDEYSIDPAWSTDGGFVVYSGPDIGTKFSVKAVRADGAPYPISSLTLTRGARHMLLLPGKGALLLLRGEIRHKNLWLVDLKSGAERQLTNLPPDFDVRDFDISRDGHEVVLERVQERSDVILLDLPRS
jgi:Tol biopolymer transport system component